MANYVRETFIWRWRSISHPPRPLPEDFNVLCPCFLLAKAETAATESELPEIVTFYAMLLNKMLELGAVHEYTAKKMRSLLVYVYALSKHYLLYIMSLSCSSSGDVREGQAGPQVEDQHPQFYNLPALIDGRVVAGVPQKNKCREPKKIPYVVLLFEPSTPSWSSYEYSSTPSILNPEVEVTYPWEITIANYVLDFQVRRTAKTKSTPRIQSPDELLAEGTLSNPCSAPSQSNPEAEPGSSSSTSDRSSRSSSFEGTSTSSSPGSSLALGSLVLKRKGCTPPVTKIVAEGSEFPRAPTCSDLQDGLGSHFPDPKVVTKGKRSAVEKQYLLPAEYSFVIPEPDATINEPSAKCITLYWATLNYGLRFPLHPVIREILNKYELAPVQIVPTSWHNICSFITTCELHGLTCSARAFGLVHMVQRAPKEIGDLGWYCFNNRSGFMTAIEKKSKLKYWKYDFLFLRQASGWGDVPDWNEGKPVRQPFREPTAEER
ncbi:LOW QUALITY PROTEIN: hypothetical protein Cgig2_021629 [Carnegiea gigantea]|uniref:Transposase (putative) gypsy type domain-containing protein n=1 Tax=Carnegiea gigantea TaxID=171969 RepID=A0A9Q1JPF1_9CARY|nr:LOW QUALITY PROTEIN: hypothetical protein Cgig2_021629 [Carnegiea gigantea]